MSLSPATRTEERHEVKRRIWEKVDVLDNIGRKEMAEGKEAKEKEGKEVEAVKVEEGGSIVGGLGGGKVFTVSHFNN